MVFCVFSIYAYIISAYLNTSQRIEMILCTKITQLCHIALFAEILSAYSPMFYALTENTLNGEISTKSVYISVNNSSNFTIF